MPAIQPARLKQQASALAAKFSQPEYFVRDIHALLEFYTDYTHRPGQAGEPRALLSAYKTPSPVMRQVWNELQRIIPQQPEAVLPLCDALWVEPNIDLQLLAVRLLGTVSVNAPEPVVSRLRLWVQSGLDKRLLDGLLEHATAQLKQTNPALLNELVSSWLASEHVPTQQAGLRALRSLITQAGAETLPGIIRLLTPYLRQAPSRLRPDVLHILDTLVESSPNEVAFALRQSLTSPDNPDTAWFIRQVLGKFPPETQASLRTALKAAR